MLMSSAATSHLGFAPLSGRLLLPTLEDTIDIDYLFLLVFPQEFEGVHERFWDEDLDEGIPDDASGSDENAVDVSAKRERH